MDINLTLLGEMITFAILVWVTMKYIWPPLIKVIEERQKKIADGLNAAERGQNDLKIAQEKVKKQLRDVKKEAATIMDSANKQATKLVEESRREAGKERSKILNQAQKDIEIERNKAKALLQKETSELVIAATEKVLQKNIDENTHKKLVDELITNI